MDLDHSGGVSMDEIRLYLEYFTGNFYKIDDKCLRKAFYVDDDQDLNMIIAPIEFKQFLVRIFKYIDSI